MKLILLPSAPLGLYGDSRVNRKQRELRRLNECTRHAEARQFSLLEVGEFHLLLPRSFLSLNQYPPLGKKAFPPPFAFLNTFSSSLFLLPSFPLLHIPSKFSLHGSPSLPSSPNLLGFLSSLEANEKVSWEEEGEGKKKKPTFESF